MGQLCPHRLAAGPSAASSVKTVMRLEQDEVLAILNQRREGRPRGSHPNGAKAGEFQSPPIPAQPRGCVHPNPTELLCMWLLSNVDAILACSY